MDLFRWLKNAFQGNQRPVVYIPEPHHTQPIRMRYCFSGQVQGVGFRYEAMMVAEQLKLTGLAKNKSDGTVVVEIEGEASYIDEFLRVMQAIPRFQITDIQVEELPLSGVETSFNAMY